MSETRSEALLQRAAQRAESKSFYVAWALAAYRSEHALEDEAMAEWLGCDPTQLVRLGLCRRPEARAANFANTVRQIATYAGVQPLRLASLLREVSALEALRGSPPSAALLAARDADESHERE